MSRDDHGVSSEDRHRTAADPKKAAFAFDFASTTDSVQAIDKSYLQNLTDCFLHKECPVKKYEQCTLNGSLAVTLVMSRHLISQLMMIIL